MALLNKYQWPGNIRELEHVIERSCVLCHGSTIATEQLPQEIQHPDSFRPPSVSPLQREPSQEPPISTSFTDSTQYQSVEGKILAALKKTGGNKAKASRLLGMDRSTLYRKIKELKIDLSSLDT